MGGAARASPHPRTGCEITKGHDLSRQGQNTSAAIKVEPAHLAHVEVLAALHRRCFQDAWSPDAFSSLLVTPGTSAFIAVNIQTDSPVGFVLLRAVAGEAEILSIGVIGEARTQGLGGLLVQEVAGLPDIQTLFLDVAADNESALRLYRREGFEEVGRRAGYYARGKGGYVDSLTMKRNLG